MGILVPVWVKTLLIASFFIVAAFGVGVWFWSRWKVNQIKARYASEQEKINRQKLIEKRGDNWNKVPYELKDFWDSKTDDNDLENWINSVYLNDAQEVLVATESLEYETATLLTQTQANISTISTNIKVNWWNKMVSEFPHYFKRALSLVEHSTLQDKKFNLILASNLHQSNISIYEYFYSKLTDNGMIIIRQDKVKKSDLKELASLLKTSQITHEISSIKSKFIYIVKNK
ncbi:hypothetical protein MCAL160_0198 [Mycoplasmopsis californica HAZ160_1]|uniref:Transmembrane protein n=1 Tax=Mycoplasmopsis californica HAZ160_1 TaxID=1397850 RepID=A0AAT9F7N5_9BACT|nr:hypothetical protein [Mycoplasmopsis californica]BAP00894.1 hypothetical protein MCAL160_0198 [Mycoplasmopsis californica HAZ160_1]BBG40753.1 hypothetical protein MCAL106_0198 [Mycoplasmopsis californica]BBG41347.1 hypothetical protein MCAL106E_0198 [Mycoplasmopsis californica]BBG41940.1 hypothetical protein MCAL106L_0198 [Mycoplasmopsis californica]BBG42530.1 hypothetical protein MCAL160E_0198 [Mycoplasmopsis californica]